MISAVFLGIVVSMSGAGAVAPVTSAQGESRQATAIRFGKEQASQAGSAAPAPAVVVPSFIPPVAAKPFQRLFPPIVGSPLRQGAAASLTSQQPSMATPHVLCGLALIPVDPKLDAEIRRSTPAQTNHDFKIRRLAPSTCRQ